MIHWHYIGYFDPAKPLDLSRQPAAPQPTKPLSVETVKRLAKKFAVKLGEHVVFEDGYLLSRLGIFEELHPFEAELVAEGCVVLTEMGFVVQPPDAAAIWQQTMVATNWGNKPTEHSAVDAKVKVGS